MKIKDFRSCLDDGAPIVVTYGGGVNSKSILCRLYREGIRPDIIVFADTGGEVPKTYQDIALTQNWLFSIGWPGIDIVKATDKHGVAIDLYDFCYNNGDLPSKAYGNPSCSDKHKTRQVTKFLNRHPICKDAWGKYNKLDEITKKVIRVIGIDYGESHRINQFLSSTAKSVEDQNKKYEIVFPLVDWRMDRDDCIVEIMNSGLPVPPKSSCYFCPSMKAHEIFELGRNHPELLAKALEMEGKAKREGNLRNIAGLGRSWSWDNVVGQGDLFTGFVGDNDPCVVCND
jgi:3'-phosphoadenosine 5'-phosphosulfate sulfotransferase (PAPS reductase)/FAD synthetase